VTAQYGVNNILLRRYFYGPGIDEPILITAAGVGTYYYHFDGLGSVIALYTFAYGVFSPMKQGDEEVMRAVW